MENKVNSELLKGMDLPSQLQEILPCGYSYKLKKWTPFENNSNHFEAVIFTNVYTEEEAQEWWHEFNVKSNTTMRVRATCPKTGKVNTFKIYLRCLHQGRAEKNEKQEQRQKTKSLTSSLKRNTNCPAGIIVAIRRHVKYSRSKLRDPVDPVHPCEIQIRFVHNHPTNGADSLRFRPVSKEVEEKLLKLYQSGHSPASALETLKIDLQIEHGSLYSQVVADRFHCPDKSFCYRLYYKHFGKDYSISAKNDLISALEAKVQHYNAILGETCLAMQLFGSDCAIAVCTPLMKRANSLPHSCNVVFVEAFESPNVKERGEHHVLLLTALTPAGGVPLGAVFTTCNNVASFKFGFQMLKQLLPTNAFSGRGMEGPCAFLTEDSEIHRTALQEVWPDCAIITCIFGLLQHLWRWLWDEKHNILKDHRLYLLYLAKTLLFSINDIEMNEKYQALCTDNIAVHYPLYLQIMKSLWERRQLWQISSLQQLSPLQGASNYYEAAARIHKDKLFEPTRTFNVVQLLNYLVTRVDTYYRTKLLDILNSKSSYIFRTYFSNVIPSHIENEIKQVSGNYFLVPGEQDCKVYTIDAELNVCSCPYGINGALCLHQYWVFLKMPADMFKVGFLDSELSQRLSVVATGIPQINSHPELTLEISNVCLNQALSNMSNIQLVTSEGIAEPLFVHSSLFQSVQNVPQTSSHLISLPDSQIVSLPTNINICNQDSSVVFVTSLPEAAELANGSMENGNSDENINSCIEGNINGAIPNVQVEQNGDSSTENVCSNTPEISEEKKEDKEAADTEKRMVKILDKFEEFCQRVKNGLKQQPNEFLPALEIMMKNLERKGNSNDLIVSGLSFFGVISAPSLVDKGRKRILKSKRIISEEIIPKVHGRQMITYGKRRLINKDEQATKANEPAVSKDNMHASVIIEKSGPSHII